MALNNVFKPHIKKLGFLLLIELTKQFHELLVTLDRCGGNIYFYFRVTIENNEAHHYSEEPLDFYIDTIRELWEILLSEDKEKAVKICDIWCEIDEIMFQRLSLHAARKILEIEDA